MGYGSNIHEEHVTHGRSGDRLIKSTTYVTDYEHDLVQPDTQYVGKCECRFWRLIIGHSVGRCYSCGRKPEWFSRDVSILDTK